MIYYRLDKELSVEKLVKDIEKLLRTTTDHNSKILVISLQKIINYAGDSPLPKIEYKPDSLT